MACVVETLLVRKAVANGETQHVAWAYERPGGGRGFGFTGGHNHVSWQDDNYRKIMLNAILWTAGMQVPENGVDSTAPDDQEIESNLILIERSKSRCRTLHLSFCSLYLFAFAAHGKQPNILFCISDDQSYAHTGANGDPVVKTPAFDRVAREGIRFTRTFCDAPTCGPSRSAILTGQSIWRLEEAGNLWSTLPKKFITYPEVLAKAGYSVGFTGKAWSPGRLSAGGRDSNPAGMEFQKRKLKPSFKWMRNTDYAANFDDFLGQVKEDQPFCFWLGTSEPHRGYELGAGKRTGKDPSKVIVPGIFPDNSIVRNDILDYYVEVEHFDKMVARAIRSLEKLGQLDNTIVVVTSDHGMPFPRAKASLYDAGTHVPLAIRWPKGIRKPGRVSHALVNLSDLAPTFLEAAGISIPKMMIGKALTDILKDKTKVKREAAFIAMERHAGCR